MHEKKILKVDAEVIQGVVNYLATKPINEALGLLQRIERSVAELNAVSESAQSETKSDKI